MTEYFNILQMEKANNIILVPSGCAVGAYVVQGISPNSDSYKISV